VLGLELIDQLQMARTCKNCIFRKMYMRLYNKEVMYEKEILEQVYINLWGLSLVVFAKRAKYFIMLMDSIINL